MLKILVTQQFCLILEKETKRDSLTLTSRAKLKRVLHNRTAQLS